MTVRRRGVGSAHEALEEVELGLRVALEVEVAVPARLCGELADVVVVRADTPSMVPLVNPVAQLVPHAQRGEVDTVLINGRVNRGRLVGVDFERARRLGEASMNHLRERIGQQQWQEAQNPGPFQLG